MKHYSTVLLPLLLILLAAVFALQACSLAPPASPAPATTVAATAPSRPTTAVPPSPTATAPPTTTPVPPSPTATATASPTAPALPTLTPTAAYLTHTVAADETLSSLAYRYGVTAASIRDANELANPNFLAQGQKLRIPLGGAAYSDPLQATRTYGYQVIGFSSQGRAIEVFTFGEGDNNIVLVGGVHGGYEWNTVLLAYQIIDYYNGNRFVIPDGITIHVIPVANPDGLFLVTGRDGRFDPNFIYATPPAARFNGNNVDLNRNFSCGWSPTARWGGRSVDPGPAPFSEPESRTVRDYLLATRPRAAIFWHSAFSLVAPGICGDNSGSIELAQLFADASGYPLGPFTAYELSGTASDWANEQGIPAMAVELTDHDNTEFVRNIAGVQAVLDFYAAPSEPAAP